MRIRSDRRCLKFASTLTALTFFFFFNDTATTEIYTLSLHDALPIYALRAALEASGHRFCTETDTETLAHLIEDVPAAPLEARVIAALAHVVGTYGVAVISADDPGKVVVARQGSPVLLGIGEGELFAASDASAILEHTRSVVYLDDGDIAVLTATGYHIIDAQDHVQLRAVNDIAWDLQAIELGGYPHFM